MADKPLENPENTSMTSEDYQKMLGTESYKQLLQADLQAENAKNVALRNTNMALQNAGLQGNSYGGTLANQTSNAYLTALQQNMSDFGTNIGSESTNNFEKITAQLSEAQDQDEFLARAKDMGLIGEGDKLTFENAGYLNDTDKQQLATYYNSAMRDYEKENNNDIEEEDYETSGKIKDGSEVQIKFSGKGTKNNEDVTLKIGEEQYSVRMSNKGYRLEIKDENGKFMSATALKDKFSNQKTGVPFVYEYTRDGKKCATILIKDKGGEIRRLETKVGGRQSMINLAKKLGVKSDTKLQVRNYSDVANTWEYIK